MGSEKLMASQAAYASAGQGGEKPVPGPGMTPGFEPKPGRSGRCGPALPISESVPVGPMLGAASEAELSDDASGE